MPGLSALKPASPGTNALQQRRDELQREVAVDHGRHAREDLEHRPDDPADAGRRVLAEIDGRQQARRQRHHHRDARTRAACPPTSGRTPKCLSEKSGVQTVPNRNSVIGTSRRNADRLEQQDEDDAGGDEDRRRRAEKQRALDDELDDRARARTACDRMLYLLRAAVRA